MNFGSNLVVNALTLAAGIGLLGCSFNRVAVNTTAGVLSEAESSTRAYFDWESAGYAAPSGIMQLEGLHSVSPDNDGLSLTLLKAYMAYAYGWVMDSYEEAYFRGDFVQSDHHKQRAYLMYSRARDLGLRVLRRRDERFPDMMNKDPKTLRAYLDKAFDDDDLPALFWLMMSWTSAVNNSPNMDDLADMSSLRVIAEWVVKRNPGYEDAGALAFLGGFESSFPAQLGGHPEKGKAYFEQAVKLTQRKNHILLINYATLYAVVVQDKALYLSLLHEILESGDQGALYRLSNKVARRRAARALARVDELFF
jgi:DNA-binding phage protein